MGFHERKVNASHGFGGQVQAFSSRCNLLAERAQDAQDFIALGEFKLAELIVELNDRNGFNKKGGTRSTLVVDDRLDLPLVFGAQGQKRSDRSVG